jgi:PmbA protein
VESILDQAKKVAEEAEVFTYSSEETPVHFEANRLKQIQSKQSSSIALRIIKNGRIGYASTTESGNIQNLIDMAVETAQFGMTARFKFPAIKAHPQIDIFDPDVVSVSTGEMINLGEQLISVVREKNSELLCEAFVTRGTSSINIINSRGGEAEYKRSFFSLGVEGQLIRGTDMLFVGDSQSSCHPILKTTDIVKEVLKQLEYAREQATVPTKSLPVIFTPEGVANALISPLMSAFNGKLVLEGASPIGKRIGQKVFNEKLSLWDDPTISYQPGSRPCDDEGVTSQQTPLIEQGVVTHFLYDLQTAAMANTQSTGNGRRSGGLPAPSPSAFVIATGDTTFDDMVSDIKEGLVVEYLMGATQGNILGGDFSGNVLLGYKIENGKIAGRVKDTMVSGNIYHLLSEITAIGSEAKWIGGMLNTPPIYLPGVSVASK